MENFNLYLDGLLIFLMSLTIIHALKLNKELKNFKQYKNDFKSIMSELSQNFDKADHDLQDFKKFAQNSSLGLNQQAQKALEMIDELKIIIDAGDRIASRLEETIETSKSIPLHKKASTAVKADMDYYKNSNQAHSAMRDDISTTNYQTKNAFGKIKSKAEKEIMKALKIKAR